MLSVLLSESTLTSALSLYILEAFGVSFSKLTSSINSVVSGCNLLFPKASLRNS